MDKVSDRIEINPSIMVGKPVIKGTRITVQHVLNMLSSDMSIEDILKEYEGLERKDILACISFASNTLEENAFLPL